MNEDAEAELRASVDGLWRAGFMGLFAPRAAVAEICYSRFLSRCSVILVTRPSFLMGEDRGAGDR